MSSPDSPSAMVYSKMLEMTFFRFANNNYDRNQNAAANSGDRFMAVLSALSGANRSGPPQDTLLWPQRIVAV